MSKNLFEVKSSKVICKHCKAEYENTHDYLEDCFMGADGWSWDYFHKCLSDKGIEIHGYRTQ